MKWIMCECPQMVQVCMLVEQRKVDKERMELVRKGIVVLSSASLQCPVSSQYV